MPKMPPAVERKYLSNTWVELSASAYAGNIRYFRRMTGKRPEFSVVINANAYGHGWQSIARLAVKNQVDSFCVHSLDEALRLRRAGFHQNILIMGHVPLGRLEAVVEAGFRIVVYNRETLEQLHHIAENSFRLARVHLKLETGTYRQGIDLEDLDWFIRRLKHTPRVLLEAVYTHFADIGDGIGQDYAEYQRYSFQQQVRMIQKAGFPILKKHAACTAAILLFPETHFDLIRLGIGQYGLWPSAETRQAYREKNGGKAGDALKPVLSWKTRISQIKTVPADNTVGYGRTFTTARDSRIAVLPVGYADGYDRQLSNRGQVLIRGRRAPVCGRICMNLMMVDVTDIPDVSLEDEVVLIGRQGREQISADDLAELCGTINYEVIARINSELPRIIVE